MYTCPLFPVELREAAAIAEEKKQTNNKTNKKNQTKKKNHKKAQDLSFSLSSCIHPRKTVFGNPYKLERTTK